VAGVILLAWLLTKYVEQPVYRVLAAIRVPPVRRLGFRALAWLGT
jgi:peptidoglycan/LPS O-acetylase OafA/YrhL